VKGPGLTAFVAALGLAAVLSACGSSSGGIYTPVHPIAIPPGYQRIGGVGQGMYLAVPKSWTVVDLAAQTPTKAFLTLLQKLPADDSEITNQVEHGVSVWGPVHAVYALDLASAASSPGQYATSLSAFCNTSGTNQSRRAGLPFLHRDASRLGNGAYDIHQTAIRLSTVPGLEVTYSQHNQVVGTIYGAQLDALPSPGRICLVTLYATGALPVGVLSKITRTVQYL
jgi:hypothetical protein